MNDELITIEELKHFTPEEANMIRKLSLALGDHAQPLSDEDLQQIIDADSTVLYVARISTGQIAGMVTLSVYRIPYKTTSWIDDLAVDPDQRGKGIGEKLLSYSMEEAKRKHANSVNFTSKPARESANKLYERLGFSKRETNVYRITF